jgi:epoxyqueuosine reductase
MKAAIRQRAAELGFDECRFTSAIPPASAEQFQRWLAQKKHGEMSWLERNAEKRADPGKVLPGVKTVIVLAASYETLHGGRPQEVRPEGIAPLEAGTPPDTPIEQSLVTQADTWGVVAQYAQFADYHDVLGGCLKNLAGFVNQLGGPETRSLWYVDTGPLLERDLAQRAGLGFVGKHTNVISRRLGNWIFLAEILTTLELSPDVPEKNHCGNCVRCIAACPTNAITAPFQLDARKCISYLTIELKGSIPPELRPAVGRRIFGCDDCLAVCPWNRFAREGSLMRSHVRADLRQPDLLGLLELDEAGFKARFSGTPLWRTKRRGLLRNVCVALGNVGDASVLPALQKAARDPESLIAEHARWALEQVSARR